MHNIRDALQTCEGSRDVRVSVADVGNDVVEYQDGTLGQKLCARWHKRRNLLRGVDLEKQMDFSLGTLNCIFNRR